MRRFETGGASLEWLATVLIVAVMVVAIGSALGGALDPRPPVREALRAVGLVADTPPPLRPEHRFGGSPGDPIIGRFAKGSGRFVARAGAGEVRRTGEEIRYVAGFTGRASAELGKAFAAGFHEELMRQVRDLTLPTTVRDAATAAIGGLWAKTPHAQAVRLGMSGGRVIVATVSERSLTAGARASGREAAARVVSYLVGGLRKRVGGAVSRERPAPGGPPPGPLSTGGFRPPVATG